MKIKLSENQLQRILKEMRFDGKKPIEFSDETVELEQDNLGETNKVNELYKSTYNSAASEAMEKGDEELALDFLRHSNEMGMTKLKGVYPPDVDGDGDKDIEDAKHCTYSDHCDYNMDGYIDDSGEPVKNYNFYGVGSSDIDADGIPDYMDDELSVDRFDIRQRIQSELNTMNEYFAEVPKDKYNKWDRLERDVDSCIRTIIETHKDNFGYDSYGVIDAIYQIMDGMFQRV